MLDDYQDSQPIVYKILKNSILKNRNSHAYLFETKGYPKQMDIALAFAKYILCPNHHHNPEDSKNCPICQRITDGNFTELKIIEPDGLWIKKEQLAELQEEFSKKSIESNKKVYIIHHAEKLNSAASNSILKFLEEPEENIVAILLADNLYQLLGTILSRCQIISFSNLNSELTHQEYGASNQTLFKIGTILMDDEENLKKFLNDEKNVEKIEQTIKFVSYYETHGQETLISINKLWLNFFKEKEALMEGFQILKLLYKDVLNLLLNRKIEIMQEYEEEIKKIAQKNDIISISKKLNILLEEEQKIKVNVNSNLLMDKLILKFQEVDNHVSGSRNYI